MSGPLATNSPCIDGSVGREAVVAARHRRRAPPSDRAPRASGPATRHRPGRGPAAAAATRAAWNAPASVGRRVDAQAADARRAGASRSRSALSRERRRADARRQTQHRPGFEHVHGGDVDSVVEHDGPVGPGLGHAVVADHDEIDARRRGRGAPGRSTAGRPAVGGRRRRQRLRATGPLVVRRRVDQAEVQHRQRRPLGGRPREPLEHAIDAGLVRDRRRRSAASRTVAGRRWPRRRRARTSRRRGGPAVRPSTQIGSPSHQRGSLRPSRSASANRRPIAGSSIVLPTMPWCAGHSPVAMVVKLGNVLLGNGGINPAPRTPRSARPRSAGTSARSR